MVRAARVIAFLSGSFFLLTACQAQPAPVVTFDAADIRFSGARALELETEFVLQFPHRHSGQPNNRLAAEWLLERFTALGLSCEMDNWEIINYSRSVGLNNVVCRLPGDSEQEILIIAHLDQAPTTVQGADNDGSGIAILLELAEIFAAEPGHRYTLAFVATDAEEYGMLGSRRYISTHPNPKNVLAGISLDNLGRPYYDAMSMELIGQFKGYGPIWLALAAREAARAAGADWEVLLRAPFDQITDQAAPVSLMDQGSLVARGVPAMGLSAHVPPGFTEAHFNLWHDPSDTLEQQTAKTLGQSGLVAEALIRQLVSMGSFPQESGPYLYFDESGQVLRGAPLWAIFIAFVAIFGAVSWLTGRRPPHEMLRGWREALPQFLGLWLPLVLSIVLLYVMVALGLMDKYHLYPATSKDPLLYQPRWPAVIIFMVGLGALLFLGRRLAAGAGGDEQPRYIKSLAMLVIALCGLYILAVNPFGLFFMMPLLFWLLIRGRRGLGRPLDVLFFLLGGLVVYALVYTFGFIVLRLNWAMLWYLLNMFSVGMISFPMAAVIMAIIAAGLTLVVDPPAGRRAA
jgi:hypothetical protein